MAMPLVTVATLRQTTLHVTAGIVVCGIIACNMARVKTLSSVMLTVGCCSVLLMVNTSGLPVLTLYLSLFIQHMG